MLNYTTPIIPENFVIRPTSDIFIADMFSNENNHDVLRSMINAVIVNAGDRPIRTARVLNPFNVRDFPAAKRIILDVRVKNEIGTGYNIEIQTHPHRSFHERIAYGWATSYSKQMFAGEDYSQLQPVYYIVITEFRAFSGIPGVHLVFELRERNNPQALFTKHIQIHYLRFYEIIQGNLSVLDGILPELRNWILFLNFGAMKGEAEMSHLVNYDVNVLKAYQEFHRFTADPAMHDFYRQRLLGEMDYQMGMNDAREEGKAEGLTEKAIEAARSLQRDGIDSNAIARATGLSLGDIAKLK